MLQPQAQIGPYTLAAKIGEGNFGVVWLGERRTSIVTTRFALKFPKDADLKIEAIKQEAEVWMRASGHPNVLPIIEAESYDGQVVIVSEYVPDGSLKTWLMEHDGKAPTVEDAVEMMLGILAGLDHLHQRGIIHRDLKPDNILLQRGTPRLADFGIARLMKTVQSGVVAGTPAYMAPEVFDGQRTAQTDIWAAGALLYQLLSGQLPFPQPEMSSLFKALITLEPEPLPDAIPQALKNIVARALKKEPPERFQSAGEMRQALRAANRSSDLQATLRTSPFAGEANLGPLVAKMCNRRQQENEFSDFFIANLKQLPGCPQIFLIRGEEKEGHDSLIERLVSTRIKQVAEKKWGAQSSTIVFKSPDWTYDGTLDERQLEIKRTLFSEFDPAYMEDDLSAKALSRLPTLALSPVVVLRYRIHASRWDEMTTPTLNWFLSYWAGLVLRSSGPQFLIFFSIIYPRQQTTSWWKSLMGAKGFNKQNLEAEMQAIAAACKGQLPLLVMKELTPIQPHEVHDWFSRYNIYDEKKRHELSEKIFETQGGRKATQLNMADIEHALFQIHQTYVKERGYL